MSGNAEQHAEIIFYEAFELLRRERGSFLDAACAGNALLRAEVEELIAAHERATNFLPSEGPASPLAGCGFPHLKPEQDGDCIGLYKLLEQIGEGGFGTVWVAEQERPVRRRVALKIIKPGMDSKQVIARFEQERQAPSPKRRERWLLEDLDVFTHHPNPNYSIKHVLDVEFDGSGNIYVFIEVWETIPGKGNGTTTVTRTVIRERDAGVWSTVDVSFPVEKAVCVGADVYCITNTSTSWEVRKSSDGGNNWTLVNTYRYDVSGVTESSDIAADGNGNLFVVGIGRRTTKIRGQTTNLRYWIVRKGIAGGTAWEIYPPFLLDPLYGGHNVATAVTVDAGDNVHVTGQGARPGASYWVTRQLAAVTGEWTTTDDFNLGTGYSSLGNLIATDPFGNVFSGGKCLEVSPADSPEHYWVVRRKLARPAP